MGNSGSHDFRANTNYQLIYTERTLYNMPFNLSNNIIIIILSTQIAHTLMSDEPLQSYTMFSIYWHFDDQTPL